MRKQDNTNIGSDVRGHLDRLVQRYPQLTAIYEDVLSAFLRLVDCYEAGGKVLLAGNGGSSADCDHIVGELMKGFRLKRNLDGELHAIAAAALRDYAPGAAQMLQSALPAISLTSQTALTSAFANDVDSDLGIAQQVLGYGRPGDVFWGISTSGNARNVNIAARLAGALGLTTIGLTGERGGQLREACDVCVCVPGSDTAEVQELHMPVYHTLCTMLESHFFAGQEKP